MTNEEWERAENALKDFLNYVKLDVDGYKLTLQLQRVSTYKAGIVIYINEKFKGVWLSEDCEERRRFLRKSERRIFTESYIKKMKCNKKEAETLRKKTFSVYHSTWSSFKSFKRHLINNNKEINLIEIRG